MRVCPFQLLHRSVELHDFCVVEHGEGMMRKGGGGKGQSRSNGKADEFHLHGRADPGDSDFVADIYCARHIAASIWRSSIVWHPKQASAKKRRRLQKSLGEIDASD